ncbi:hypothetical protein DINM_003090 [Dirofilaria immitis]|nr:hypothetical protein [Dirofilaria immitis]
MDLFGCLKRRPAILIHNEKDKNSGRIEKENQKEMYQNMTKKKIFWILIEEAKEKLQLTTDNNGLLKISAHIIKSESSKNAIYPIYLPKISHDNTIPLINTNIHEKMFHRTTTKCLIALFYYLTTRTTHLEVVQDLRGSFSTCYEDLLHVIEHQKQ